MPDDTKTETYKQPYNCYHNLDIPVSDALKYITGDLSQISVTLPGSRKFCQRESNSTLTIFLVDEGKEDTNTSQNGTSSAYQRNAILMSFGWRADNDPTLNAGLVALWVSRGFGPVLLRNTIAL